MRCPKCHYISFGSVDRCRNCGYEFALAADAKPLDLPIQPADQTLGPLGDLELGDRPANGGAAPQTPGRDPSAAAVDRMAAGSRAGGAARFDLPLFVDRDPLDDAPLISVPSAPRQPLSVRRAQPAFPKPAVERPAGSSLLEQKRAEPDDARDDLDRERDDDDDAGHHPGVEIRASRPRPRPSRALTDDAWEVAPALTRLAAGLIDVLVLAAIDAGVIFATLRVLGLSMTAVALLPPVPMIVFLVLLDGGYLTIFTVAGGQTIGKMIAGIRVIAQRPDDDSGFDTYTPRVTMGSAVLRATAYIVSLLPAGLGFAAILLDRDGRALHDRLAETRVVKA